VQHHFNTKTELQAAVEAYVLEKLSQLATVSLTEPRTPGKFIIGRQLVEFIRQNPEIIGYVRRVILEDAALGRRLFDQIFVVSRTLIERLADEGFLHADLDPAWATLNTMLMVLGPVLLEPAINRHLDRPFRSDEGLARWDAAVDDMLTRGIYRERIRPSARTRKSPRSPRKLVISQTPPKR